MSRNIEYVDALRDDEVADVKIVKKVVSCPKKHGGITEAEECEKCEFLVRYDKKYELVSCAAPKMQPFNGIRCVNCVHAPMLRLKTDETERHVKYCDTANRIIVKLRTIRRCKFYTSK
ncbi:MAG: hypothetical protein QW327_01610 [Candidatus Odinarchaeota archaeon]